MDELQSTRQQVYARLTEIFRDVFDNPSINLFDAMTAKDLAQWDSLNHINLVVAVEQKFHVRFNTREVAQMANVGEFVDTILHKAAPGS
jgi:acyl carrier protein